MNELIQEKNSCVFNIAAGYTNTRLPFCYVCTAENGGVGVCCLNARPCRGRNVSEASAPRPVSCEAVPVRFCVPAASFGAVKIYAQIYLQAPAE